MPDEEIKQPNTDPLPNGEKSDRDNKGRFVEGNPGGPGRPEGSISFTAAIKKRLEEIPKGEKKTYLLQVVDVVMNKAVKEQDKDMIKLLWNYIDGMPKTNIDLSHGLQEGALEELTDFFRELANPKKDAKP